MGRRIVSGGCHPAERKNGDFVALRRLSPDGEELDGGGAGCHPTEKSWMVVGHVSGASSSGPRSKRRLFIASSTLSGGGGDSHFSRVYNHSLPHSRLAIGDVEGEWRTRAPIGPS
ncbi:unnamed protein product [Spirodela intermedia]|uniref:Uncharacterized protein n=1 Tax=Spirodela intermedia TaxID=51605 RepID=A0A7I8K807_SPIIN|nr:unnamed protein product [Spirodela intermedia]